MDTTLWITQAALATLFAAAGALTAATPRDKLAPKLPWVTDFAPPVVRLIGVVELLGAAGLVLPAITGIAPVLTPVAATGLAVMMALAATVHIRRKETGAVVLNAVLLALTAFVAWGRFGEWTP